MADDKNISNLPSGYRKSKEAKEAKPASERPKMIAPPPKPFFPYEQEPKPVEPVQVESAPVLGSGFSGKIALLALLIALCALVLAFMSFQATSSVKAEAREIAADLRSLKDTPVTVPSTISTTARVSFQVPLKQVMLGGKIPLHTTVPVSGTGRTNIPVYGVTDISFNGTVSINQEITIDSSNIPPEYTLSVQQDVPLSLSTQTSIRPGQAWPDQLNDMIRRLERISS